MTEIRPGCLLVSRPAMLDPNFDGTVVLICTHDEHGTVGLTLNRPLEVALEDMLPPDHGLATADGEAIPLLWGGPVGTDCLHLLSSGEAEEGVVLEVLPQVNFGGDLEVAKRVLHRGDELRLFVGYSGWSPGQLEEEMAQEAWHVVPAEAGLVWSRDWRLLWEQVMAKIDPRYGWMTEIPKDPEVN